MSSTNQSRQPIEIPEPSGVLAEPWSLGKIGRLAALFGPAAIVASVSIGAGETIVVVQAGSWGGYSLLWLVLASVLVKGICVTYLLGRYTAVSGEAIGRRLVDFPGPRGWLLISIIVLELAAAGPLWAAIAKPSGDLMYFLLHRTMAMGADGASISKPPTEMFGIAESTWQSLLGTTFITVALASAVNTSFKWLERQQVIICSILVVGTIAGTIMVKPDLIAAAIGTVSVGSVPDPIPSWAPQSVHDQPILALATTFGYVGGSVMCYIVYANFISLHGWGLCGHPRIAEIRQRAAEGSAADYLPPDSRQAARLRRLIGPLRWDVSMGAFVLFVVSASFMLAGASVLGDIDAETGAKIFDGWSLLTDQGQIWSNIHPALVWVYYVCVLAALWGTLQSYPEIYARVTSDFVGAVWPAYQIPYRRLQLLIIVYVFVTASAFIWTNVPFATLTAVVSFLATTGGVALAMVAALYLNFQLPPLYRTRAWMLAAGVLSAAILIAVTAISGWALLRGLL